MRFKTYRDLTAACAVATMLAGGPAFAQEQPPAPAPVPAESVSDDQLEAFAMVALEVAQVRDQYAAQLAAAGSEEEQQRIVDEGNAAMLTTVEESDLITIDEYLVIGEAAAADPELNQRIAQLLDEMDPRTAPAQ